MDRSILSKILLTASFALPLTHSPSSWAIGGGNGGAGVEKNGVPMTFYSAGVIVEPVDQTLMQIPGLMELIEFVEGSEYLNAETKRWITTTAAASPSHPYYEVSSGHFDAKVRKRLIEEFRRVTGANPSTIDLFALTDTQTRQTFLLPSFFKLKTHEQMAILFHEAYWLKNPSASYDDVVAIEAAFQAVIEKPGDFHRARTLLQYLGTAQDLLQLAVQADLASGALNGLVDGQKRIALKDLFGKSFMTDRDLSLLNLHFYRLKLQYPDSFLIDLLQKKLPGASDGIRMTIFDGDYYYAMREIRSRDWKFFAPCYGTVELKDLTDGQLPPYLCTWEFDHMDKAPTWALKKPLKDDIAQGLHVHSPYDGWIELAPKRISEQRIILPVFLKATRYVVKKDHSYRSETLMSPFMLTVW